MSKTTAPVTANRYARRCDECGKGTNAGYYADGPIYCSSECLDKNITPEEWDDLCDEGASDDHYYTEWDIASELSSKDATFYDAEGAEFRAPGKEDVPCPYCFSEDGDRGRCASYWTHDLSDTIDAPCHACDGDETIDRESFPYIFAQAGDYRREQYAKVYPECEGWR